jgi:hypothetical protein
LFAARPTSLLAFNRALVFRAEPLCLLVPMFDCKWVVLWLLCWEPLLCGNRKRGKYTRPVSRQRLGNKVPIATNRRATIDVLLERGFSTQSMPRSYKEDNWGDQVQFCTGVCKEKNSAHEDESPLLKSVTRKCLVKTLQAGEDLACIDL